MWWGKSKQEEKRGAGMLAFPFIFSSTEFREAAERGPETGKIPFLWSNAFWNVVMDPTCLESPRRLNYSTPHLMLKTFKSTCTYIMK